MTDNRRMEQELKAKIAELELLWTRQLELNKRISELRVKLNRTIPEVDDDRIWRM